MTDHLVLVGMMGAGKSTVGRRVASSLRWSYYDTDESVAHVVGRSVAEVFAHEGEARFRTHEQRALRRALESPAPAVISVGGGAVLRAENRALLREAGRVVWLRARPETLARRVGHGTGRPLLAGSSRDPRSVLARIDAERRGRYQEVADVIVDTDELDESAVVEHLLTLVRAPRRAGERCSAPKEDGGAASGGAR